MRKILAFCLIVYLTIVPPLAYATSAGASMGGWAFSSFDVATSVVTAMKNGASASVAVAKSPVSKKIAKGIAGGAIAGVAIPLAISQLTGIALDAVDWVLDPANNAIKYKDKDEDTDSSICASNLMLNNMTYSQALNSIKSQIEARSSQNFATNYEGVISVTCGESVVTIEVARSWCQSGCAPGVVYTYGGEPSSIRYFFNTTGINDNNDTYKTIPISTVADKIYDNAKTDAASASIVNNAVKDYVNEGSADVALDNAKADTDASHACGTGTHWSGSACVADPAKPADAAPLDLSGILSALQSILSAIKGLASAIVEPIVNSIDLVIQAIKDFWKWWADTWTEFKTKVFDFIDWVRGDFDNSDDVKPNVDKTPPTKSARDFDANYINFGGQCPTFQPVTISVGLVSVPISFNAQPLCDFAILCRPAILALAYFVAMAIVANAIRSD